MAFEGFHHWFSDGSLEKVEFGLEFEWGVILCAFGYVVGGKLHPEHAMNNKGQKDLDFFIF